MRNLAVMGGARPLTLAFLLQAVAATVVWRIGFYAGTASQTRRGAAEVERLTAALAKCEALDHPALGAVQPQQQRGLHWESQIRRGVAEVERLTAALAKCKAPDPALGLVAAPSSPAESAHFGAVLTGGSRHLRDKRGWTDQDLEDGHWATWDVGARKGQ
jgi:hypothetical protein